MRFTDVAKLIDPTTVSFASLTDPAGTRVLEQNFQFDLVSAEKLMGRYIGQRISVERTDGTEVKRVDGVLLDTQGALLLQLASGEIFSMTRYDDVRFPSLPGGLITRPTLVWLTDSARGGDHQAQVAYQTRGMTSLYLQPMDWNPLSASVRAREERPVVTGATTRRTTIRSRRRCSHGLE